MHLKGMAFDMDQTLYDRPTSDMLAMTGYYTAHRELFLPDCTLERAIEVMHEANWYGGHPGWNRILEIMKEANIFRVVPEVGAISSEFQRYFSTVGVTYPCVQPTLKALHDRGLKLGLITNGSEENQWMKIRHFGFDKCFDRILIGSDAGTAKPHAAIFLKMAGELACKPEEMLYVGDNPAIDIEGSRQAGYVPVWIRSMPWDYPDVKRAPYEIDRISDLLPLADRLLDF